MAEEVADLRGQLQEAEREKRKRQRIELAVVVKEVVMIGDDSTEPDHQQSTDTHGTILGSTHFFRATRRVTRFEVMPGSTEYQRIFGYFQDDEKCNARDGNVWTSAPSSRTSRWSAFRTALSDASMHSTRRAEASQNDLEIWCMQVSTGRPGNPVRAREQCGRVEQHCPGRLQ